MKYLIIFVFFTFIISPTSAQNLISKIDSLTTTWDKEKKSLGSYGGLMLYCTDKEYQSEVIKLMNNIHSVDSALYIVLKQEQKKSPSKELDQAIKLIEEFEKNYSTKKFSSYLSNECKTMHELEKNKESLRSDVGSESYSGQVYLLETELGKYVKNITKSVDSIRNHAHHLQISQ